MNTTINASTTVNPLAVAPKGTETSGDRGARRENGRIQHLFERLEYALRPSRFEGLSNEANLEWLKVEQALATGNADGAIKLAYGIYRRFAGEVAKADYESAKGFRDTKAQKPVYAETIREIDFDLAEAQIALEEGKFSQAIWRSRKVVGRLHEAVAEQRRLWQERETARQAAEAALAQRRARSAEKSSRHQMNKDRRAEENRARAKGYGCGTKCGTKKN